MAIEKIYLYDAVEYNLGDEHEVDALVLAVYLNGYLEGSLKGSDDAYYGGYNDGFNEGCAGEIS